MDLKTLLKRAEAGESGGLGVPDCYALRDALSRSSPTPQALPSYCERLLSHAKAGNVGLARRHSSVGRAWDMADGHGKRTIYEEKVPGGVYSSNDEKSTVDMYMESKDPAAREKIRALVTRTASRGAVVRIPVQTEEVKVEKAKETKRRLTRRATFRADQRAKGVEAASPYVPK